MKKIKENYQLVVCGGGLAGFCAAIAAARKGINTCLVHNRPVFGGNSSSEIGVTPHGAAAFHAYARETGIISELLIEERAKNHAEIYENGWINSIWDMVMYDMAINSENLKFYLNTDIREVVKQNKQKIEAVKAIVQNAETEITLFAELFIDCTGDGMVADRAGCEWRMGSEGRDEFDEPHAPPVKANNDTMGNSIHFLARDMGKPVPFQSPEWAIHYNDASFFYKQGRLPKEKRGGFWWIEIGIPYHTIYDNEEIRHQLTRHTLGVWHWMKNQDPVMKEQTKNYALDWIGQVPGKRESRRILGKYLFNENDIQNLRVFDDEIAYGGWFVDLHTPGGLLAQTSEPATSENYDSNTEYAVKSYCGPYGIPSRSLIAKDVNNLMMAGRNISITHAALGTARVMLTTSIVGEACGVIAATAIKKKLPIAEIPNKAIKDVKQQLLRKGCFLPNNKNEDANDLARKASVKASSQALMHGAGPETPGYHEGLKIWTDQPQYKQELMDKRKGQLIAVGDKKIDTISLFLKNFSKKLQQIEARIYQVDHIWDYRAEPSSLLAKTMLEVPFGENSWIDWNVELSPGKGLKKNTYIRVDLMENKQVEWKVAGCIIPGHTAVYQIGKNKMRRFGDSATLSFKVCPGQNCFGPENVISGVTRPHRYTNLWRSNPELPLNQWIELSWNKDQSIGQIEITFPGHLIREYHAYSPFYKDPQCARDYIIKAWLNETWQELVTVKGNYQRRRVHELEKSINTSRIKIEILATNGDPSAAIYEIRCYSYGTGY